MNISSPELCEKIVAHSCDNKLLFLTSMATNVMPTEFMRASMQHVSNCRCEGICKPVIKIFSHIDFDELYTPTVGACDCDICTSPEVLNDIMMRSIR